MEEASGDYKYCTKCGNSLHGEVQRQHYCPFCGAPDEGKNFCGDCGGNLGSIGPPATRSGSTVVAAASAAGATESASTTAAAETESEPAKAGTATCPTCGSNLFYVAQYNQWYCNSCKAYKVPSSASA
jgi:predicted RNA-binding Zn-ribbon protein involved in translation (DUF1610 family)